MPKPSPFTAQWSDGLDDVAGRLEGLAGDVIKVVRRGIRRNAVLMAAELRNLTPRSEGSGDHVADGWTTREVQLQGGGRDSRGRFVAQSDFTIEVYNAHPRFDAEIELLSGGATSLGLILEYGSRPHIIKARRASKLAFFWPAIGDVVITDSVEHPGTRPYGMMAIATDAAIDRGVRLIRAAAEVLGG